MLKTFFKFFKKKNYEYVYFYILDSFFINSPELRAQVSKIIEKDLLQSKKNGVIKDCDLFTDKTVDFTSLLILSSSEINKNKFLKPLIYEIYAFYKKGILDDSVFSYEFKNIEHVYNIKDDSTTMKIYKFKIQC